MGGRAPLGWGGGGGGGGCGRRHKSGCRLFVFGFKVPLYPFGVKQKGDGEAQSQHRPFLNVPSVACPRKDPRIQRKSPWNPMYYL